MLVKDYSSHRGSFEADQLLPPALFFYFLRMYQLAQMRDEGTLTLWGP